jgi:hypothetical protein
MRSLLSTAFSFEPGVAVAFRWGLPTEPLCRERKDCFALLAMTSGAGSLGGLRVHGSVNFDDEPGRETDEIHDELLNSVLPTEPPA